MSVVRHRLAALLLSATCAAALCSAAPPDEPKPKQLVVTVADLGWFAGDWRHVEQGALSQEVWTSPQGDCLLGMWRWVDATGSSRVFELLSICQETTGPTLRLRHFDRRLHAREEKDAPLVLTLTSALQNRAVFEGTEGELRVRLSYQRDGDQLVATLTKGDQPAQEYRFHRTAP
jgi:hypothetical protein